jgi:long-chain acyl-CoA synthetase
MIIETPATLPDLFRRRVAVSPRVHAYRHFEPTTGRYVAISWQEMGMRVDRWRAALASEGLQRGERVAIRLPNGIDWVCFDQAALSLGLVVVPLFQTDSAAASAYALADSGARLAVFDHADQWRAIAPCDGLGALQRVICRTGNALHEACGLTDWLNTKALRQPYGGDVLADQLATIVYTSGTTGPPKGVMLSHRNVLSVVFAVLDRHPAKSEDVFMSYLPLAHVFERVVGYYVPMAAGACVAFARSFDRLGTDLRVVRPSVMLFVPSVLERIRQRILADAAARRLAPRLLLALDAIAEGRRLSPVQRLVKAIASRNLRQSFGGRLRLAVSGGAPLASDLARFCLALGLPLTEGYGMTEAASAVAAATRLSYHPGSVGSPLRGTEIRIGLHGEILVRSPGVMQAYWNRPKESAEALADGWLHTGDYGAIEGDTLIVSGRLKEILVLSTGHKLAPTELERALGRDPLVHQVMIVGDNRPFLVALIVLEDTGWVKLAEGLGLDPAAKSSLGLARSIVIERLSHHLRAFPTYAQIRAVHLSREAWTTDNGLLTPTMKPKRHAIEAKFAVALAGLYDDMTYRP